MFWLGREGAPPEFSYFVARSERTTEQDRAVLAHAIEALDKARAEEGAIDGDKTFDEPDMVNAPPHYRQHPASIECIDVIEHWPCCVANAMKYLWRAGEKGDAIEDLQKARWYVEREIVRRQRLDQEG